MKHRLKHPDPVFTRLFAVLLASIVVISCSDESSSSPFSEFEQAVGRNDVHAVVAMLRAGQDPNENAVLVAAARSGGVETIAALLAAGADPNITGAGRSETPVHAAASRDDADAAAVMSMLVQAGGDPCRRVDPNEPDYGPGVPMPHKGLSSVEIARQVGNPDVMTVLAAVAKSCASAP